MNGQAFSAVTVSELSTITGGSLGNLQNARDGVDMGAQLGVYAQKKTTQALQRFVGPGIATIGGMAAGLGGSVIGGVGGGLLGLAYDVHESATR